ncbi:MAG: cytochrome b N-terminal domain-containing protein [Cyanobacteria bacterium REEB67]|nr:cytochrome b N-terminal domain-containing protein [Cyanobacteria bacterium REEB67]
MPSSTAQAGGFSSALSAATDYIKSRINNIDIFDEHYQDLARANPFYALGPIFYLVWFIVMATGLILIMWYVPTKSSAFDSILNIQNGIPVGGLMRGMHKYGADAMIIAATMRLYRMFINGDFKPSRELNIAIALVTLLLAMYSGLTGYLLIWNQRAFWATKVFATFPTYMDQFAVMGDFYQPLYKSLHLGWNTAEVLLGGGAAITQNTITRFFSLHLAFSLIPLILVELYFYKNAYTRIPLNWIKRSVIILILAFVAIAMPAAQGSRSDPDVTPLPILSDWYFLGLYQMYKYLEPVVATYITMVIPVSVFLLPFMDTWITGTEKNILKRPFMLMVTIMGGLTWVIFSALIIINIANIHTDPPFWRTFFYWTIDLGIVWQLLLIMQNKDKVWKAKQFKACVVLSVVAAVQCFWAFCYTYMAKTEMFIDPLGHAAIYAGARPMMGAAADKAEELVRKMVPPNGDTPVNKDYWNFHVLLDPGYISKIGEPVGKADLEAIEQVAKSTSPVDFVTSLIPTFETADGPNGTLKSITFSNPKVGPHPKYLSMMDFMLNNRWCMDYCVMQDRLNGKVKTYPAAIPPVDLYWMVTGPLCLLFGLLVAAQCKSAQASTPAPKAAAPATAATT